MDTTNKPKILLLDIETAPNIAYVWKLFKENIPLARLVEAGYTLCWSAKWHGSDEVLFDSIHYNEEANMLQNMHDLLDEADAVVHYNGKKFDIPTLNKEFLLNDFYPPSNYKQIDLYQTVKTQFNFPSNKLEYVAKALGCTQKYEHRGFDLWTECMRGDEDAWEEMERYNVQDVIVLEEVYDKLKPWIKSHVNYNLFSDDALCCPTCGSKHFHRRGFSHTNVASYQRFQCQECGSWFRDTKSVAPKAGKKYVSVA